MKTRFITVLLIGFLCLVGLRSGAVSAGPLDGRLDIVVANLYSNDQLCINDGDASFACNGVAGTSGGSQEIAAGDFNGDSVLDVVVADRDINRVCLNVGVGTLTCHEIGTSAYTANVAVGDVDNDGDLDIVFANIPLQGRDGHNHLCLNDGQANFSCTNLSEHENSSTSVALGDINSDGNLDAIFTHALFHASDPLGVSYEQYCLNVGMGNFSCGYIPDSQEDSYALDLGDMDGDGDLDALINYRSLDKLCLNMGLGQFDCSPIEGTNEAGPIEIGDVNGDAQLDFIIGRNGQAHEACLNNGAAISFTCIVINPENIAPIDIASGDMNGDSLLDVVFSYNGSGVRQCLNKGPANGGLAEFDCTTVLGSGNSWGVIVGDFGGSAAPPVANAGGPYTVDEGGSVTLDGSGTSDPDQAADSLNFTWDLDGDGEYDDATGINPNFLADGLDGPGVVAVALTVTDSDGLTSTANASIQVVNVAPTIEAVDNDGPIVLGGQATISVAASDPGADNDPLLYSFDCDNDGLFEGGPQPGSGFVCTFVAPGFNTVNVQVKDGDGGVTEGGTAVSVIYSWTGFFQPIENLPTMNSEKAGQTIPIKFSLDGDQGLDILADGYPVSQEVDCESGVPLGSATGIGMPGNSSLKYDVDGDQYSLNWKTEKSWKGSCRQLTVKLVDQSEHIALFTFK